MCNAPEGKFLDFIAQCINYDINPPGSIKTVDCNSFSKAEFIEYLKQLINHPRYHYYYHYYISQASRNIPKASKMHIPFKCSSLTTSNPTKNLTQAANSNTTARITTAIASVATLASNFTTAISYNNSTVANIDLTTSTPEREDNTNLEVMIGSVVGAFLVGVGAAVLCYRKCYRIGTYRTGEPKTEDISSYVKNEEVDEEALLDQSNGNSDKQNQPQASASSSYTNISETKSTSEEQSSLLTNQQSNQIKRQVHRFK